MNLGTMSATSSSVGGVASPTGNPLALIEALIAQMPQCVQAAALQCISNSSCNGDIACICQDNTFFGLVEGAIEHNCDEVDGQAELAFAKMVCTAVVPDLEDNRNALIIGIYTTLMILAVISVALRLASRRISRAKFWWDDYCIIMALIFTCGLNANGLAGPRFGYGKHIITLGYYEIVSFEKLFWAAQILFTPAITATKISIVLFYYRIFPGRRFRIAAIVLGCMQMAWFISFTCAAVFACTPIAYYWNKTIPGGFCTNSAALLYSATGTNFAADLLVLCLPIQPLWGLQLRLKRKLAIMAIFVLGGFACLSAAIRLPLLVMINEVDVTWTSVNAGIWITVECNVGIVSACGPLMGPILQIISSSSIAASIRTRFTQYHRTYSLSGSIPNGVNLQTEKSLPPIPDEEEIASGTYSRENGDAEVVIGSTKYGYNTSHDSAIAKGQFPY